MSTPRPPSEDIVQQLRVRADIALAMFLVVVVVSLVAAVQQIGTAEGLANLVNRAGEHRALSSQIALLSVQLHASTDAKEQALLRQRLSEVATRFERSERYLRARAEGEAIERAGEVSHGLGVELVALARDAVSTEPQPGDVERLTELAERYVVAQDHLVDAKAARLEATVQRQKILLGVLVILLFATIAMLSVFVIRPAVARIREDVARRAEAAARDAQRLFDTSADLLCIADAEGVFLRVSPSCERILGYTPDEMEGRVAFEFVHPDDVEASAAKLGEVTLSGALLSEFRNRYRTKDGGVRVLAWRALLDPETGLFYGTGRDVTREDRLSAKLDEQLTELERSNQALDEFAYVASHDLRAPLRDIDNLATWIEEDVSDQLSEGSLEHLRLIRGRITRMENLLKDLLEYSRVGRIPEATVEVDIDALMHDVIALAAVPDRFNVDTDLDVAPFTTPEAPLKRVLLNLVSNAVKHHDRHDGNIEITVRDVGDDIVFVVADDGPGIAPEFHDGIFDLFSTLQRRDEVEGSGMGLAMIRKIVDYHGGEVSVESQAAGGAAFTVRWPRVIETASTSDHE